MGVLCSSSRAAPSSLFLCCPCRSPPCAAASTSGRGDPTSGRSPAGLSSSLSSRGRRNFYSSIVVTKNNSSVTFCSPGGFRLLFTCPSCVCVCTQIPVYKRTHTQSPSPAPLRSQPVRIWHSFGKSLDQKRQRCSHVAGGKPFTLRSACLPEPPQLWFSFILVF